MSRRAKYLESVHQAVIMRMLDTAERDGWGLTAAGDMNAGRRGSRAAAEAKMTGMKNGEPDIRVFFEGGISAFFEVKTEVGVLSQDQKDRHERYEQLGIEISVIQHVEPLDAALDVASHICGTMGWPVDKFTAYAIKAEADIMKAMGRVTK